MVQTNEVSVSEGLLFKRQRSRIRDNERRYINDVSARCSTQVERQEGRSTKIVTINKKTFQPTITGKYTANFVKYHNLDILFSVSEKSLIKKILNFREKNFGFEKLVEVIMCARIQIQKRNPFDLEL